MFTTPPDAAHIADLAERALAEIPAVLRNQIDGVAIIVEELADDDILDGMEIESAFDLQGLYRGTRSGSAAVATSPDCPIRFSFTVRRSCWNGSNSAKIYTGWCVTCCGMKLRIILGLVMRRLRGLKASCEQKDYLPRFSLSFIAGRLKARKHSFF